MQVLMACAVQAALSSLLVQLEELWARGEYHGLAGYPGVSPVPGGTVVCAKRHEGQHPGQHPQL